MKTASLDFEISRAGYYGDDAILYGIDCQYGKRTTSLEAWVILRNAEGLTEVTVSSSGLTFYEQLFGLPFNEVAYAAYAFLQKQHQWKSAVVHVDRSNAMDKVDVEARRAESAKKYASFTEDVFYVKDIAECYRKP